MAELHSAFDADSVEPNAPIELLPPGKYEVQIVQNDMRDTKTGGGKYLWLEMDILSGPFAGRKLWDRLNLVNANAQAADIAQRTLSAICRAVGQRQVTNGDQLMFKPMTATVKVKPAAGQYDASNEVKGYEATSGGASKSAPARTAAAPTTSAPVASRPWTKRTAA